MWGPPIFMAGELFERKKGLWRRVVAAGGDFPPAWMEALGLHCTAGHCIALMEVLLGANVGVTFLPSRAVPAGPAMADRAGLTHMVRLCSACWRVGAIYTGGE